MNPWQLFLEIITTLFRAGMSDEELVEVNEDYQDYLEIEEEKGD